MNAAPSTVLVYRLGSLGDTVVALPCFHMIERAFPGVRRVLLTNRPVSAKAAPAAAVLDDGGFIEDVIDYPLATRSLRALAAVASRIRAERIDTVIYLAAVRGRAAVWRDLVFFKLCGVRRVIGAPLSADLAHNRVDADGVVEPEARRLARCLASLGDIDLSSPEVWDLRLTPVEQAVAADVLRPLEEREFLAVSMGGKAVEKDWGFERWQALFGQLAPRMAPPLVVVGSAEDRERAASLAEIWPSQVLNACGSLTPRQSAAVLARAALFVGHDSGPMHLAAAAGVPCVALFGALNRPRKWHPLGDHEVLHEVTGVEHIPVDRVSRAIERRWRGHGLPGAGPDQRVAGGRS